MAIMANHQHHGGNDELIGISKAAEFLGRKPATLRSWEGRDDFPEHLMPRRDNGGRRCWTRAQLQEIRDEWMPIHAVVGSGLQKALAARGLDPSPAIESPETVEAHLAGQRKPRKHAEAVAA